jgi:hypothetical protein
MKRTCLVALAAVLACLVVAQWAGADDAAAPAPMTAEGQLSKIDGKNLTVTVKDGDATKDLALTLGDSAKVLIQGTDMDENGKPKMTEGKADDLKVGQTVKATYTDTTISQIVVTAQPKASDDAGAGM